METEERTSSNEGAESAEVQTTRKKLCRSCGNEISEIAKVCTSCGRHQSAIREAILVWAPIFFSLVALITVLGSPLWSDITLRNDINELVVSLHESERDFEAVFAQMEKGSSDLRDCNDDAGWKTRALHLKSTMMVGTLNTRLSQRAIVSA